MATHAELSAQAAVTELDGTEVFGVQVGGVWKRITAAQLIAALLAPEAGARVTDDGTTIKANSGAGTFWAGDTDGNDNSTQIYLNDAIPYVQITTRSGANGVQVEVDGDAVLARLTAGATKLEVTKLNGVIHSCPLAAPADAALGVAQLSFYAVEGSNKISFKYKDSGGVVRTGDVGTYS